MFVNGNVVDKTEAYRDNSELRLPAFLSAGFEKDFVEVHLSSNRPICMLINLRMEGKQILRVMHNGGS